MSDVNQYLFAFIETKHDTMCFNLATPLLNFELYIVSEYRHCGAKGALIVPSVSFIGNCRL